MKKAFLTLALLAAGCAGNPSPEVEVVTTHHRQQQQTQVVAEKHVEVSPSLHLVGEPIPAVAPSTPTLTIVQPQVSVQPARPTTRQMAQQALDRLDKLEQKPPQAQFFQVGPPIVINTVPTPTYQQAPPPVVVVAPTPVVTAAPIVAPVTPPVATPRAEPVLETAPGLSYQNGGVNGTTAPLATPTPALPTAEGFEYRP